MDKFFGSVGFKKVLAILSFKGVEYIYEKNCLEMVDVLSNYRTKSKDFPRVLHNYLASFATITDHCRILIKQCTEVKEEVDERIKSDLLDSPLNSFIKDLRNYTLHYSLPLKMQQVKLIDERLIVGDLIFDKGSLLEWNHWKRKSLEFLKRNDGHLVVSEVLLDHYNHIVEFYTWLEGRLEIIYSKEFKEYNRLPGGPDFDASSYFKYEH